MKNYLFNDSNLEASVKRSNHGDLYLLAANDLINRGSWYDTEKILAERLEHYSKTPSHDGELTSIENLWLGLEREYDWWMALMKVEAPPFGEWLKKASMWEVIGLLCKTYDIMY